MHAAITDALDITGDPGRIHSAGMRARHAIETAREAVAHGFGASPREVVFTGTGTEAINMAVWGALESHDDSHVVLSAVEHSAVRDAVARDAATFALLDVDHTGRINVDALSAHWNDRTRLVCVQFANHEVGTLQPFQELVAYARERGVYTLVDARAATGYALIDAHAIGADFLALSAHAAGGPMGVGALIVRRGVRVAPLIVGGAQERARRAGLENTPAIVGFGMLAELLTPAHIEAEAARLRVLRDGFLATVTAIPDVTVFGDPANGLPNLACIGVGGVEAEPIVLGLDQRGIAVHSGSSCSSEMLEPSPVLAAMGVDADHSLRISIGWHNTSSDLAACADSLCSITASLRALRA